MKEKIWYHNVTIIKGAMKMNYQEILEQARGCIGSYCKACNVCNGRTCRNQIPGLGASGVCKMSG